MLGGFLMLTGIILTIISSFMERGSQLARLATKITNILQILLFAGILMIPMIPEDTASGFKDIKNL